MLSSPSSSFKPHIIIVSTLFMILKERCMPDETELCKNSPFAKQIARDTSSSGSSLRSLILDGYFSFENNHRAARDFGNRYHLIPLAVLYPKSISDVSTVIKHIYELGPASEITVAARGHGHSIQGQSQAHQGIVINMESFGGTAMQVHSGEGEMIFVDVSGGELWINILHETLKHGLAPKSWTDYLHLSVGGTLSNGGISGQAFRHGPQINNVYQLEVVTGKGEILTCSEKQNAELFYGVLGGLGQFGIISRARISLEPAPKMVKWIRALYSKFSTFSEDQETLIMSKNYSFDFIEGFVIKNRENLVDSWRSTFSPKHPQEANQFNSDGKTFYCLEMAKYFNSNEYENMIKDVESQLSELNYIPSMLFFTEVSYMDFLDRVHASEKELRAKGLWEVPHPWLNLLIPKSKIHYFADEVFDRIISDTSIGPILIYPINKTKWNNKTSLVTPREDMFYLVGFLSSALLSVRDSLEHILSQNKRILEFCNMGVPGFKQYLPHYITQDEWADHFGPQWQVFKQRKSIYDPLAILAPGQRIFQKAIPFLGGHLRQAVIERQA